MGTQPPPKKGQSPPIFGPCLLRPNGYMDQDATRHGARPRPRRLWVRWEPCFPSPKRGRSPLPIFGPRLLWPNSWMDQDGTWHRDRSQFRRLCVRWRSSPLPKKGRNPPQFSAHFHCGPAAGGIKMPLGMEVGQGHGASEVAKSALF